MFQAFARSNRRSSLSPDAMPSSDGSTRHVHIVLVGTGFSGLGMAIRLKQDGQEDFVVLERASDIGGTWRDNTYPGCACDVQSHLYSFSFALNPHWSRSYSPQSEIRAYLRECAQRFGILPHIRWNSPLQDAVWHEDELRWHLTTPQGALSCDVLILGNGPLSEPSLPAITGMSDFQGTLFHSAQWRHDHDLTGKRVAVIGTGASVIQFVPHIQPQVAHLTLFQRTPPWIIPRLDRAIPAWQQHLYRWLPFTQRLVRHRIYWLRELGALALVYRPQILEKGMQVARQHMEHQVSDPVLREKLTPTYTMGCKRILLSDDFYPAVAQSNVELVTERIREVRAHSIVTEAGEEREIDTIICGTGFHVTDADLPRHIYGRGGHSLSESWSPDPHAYYGTTVAGFPNLFLLIGPNTGLGHTSMIVMIEAQLNYILDCLQLMERQYLQAIDVLPAYEAAFGQEMERRMEHTVWKSGCRSWYLDARGRNTTLWPGFTFEYRQRLRRFDPQHYERIPAKMSASVE